MDRTRNFTISILKDLLNTCHKEFNFFRYTSRFITNPNLKNIFNKYSLEKSKDIYKLESEIIRLGGEVYEANNEFLNPDSNDDINTLKSDEKILSEWENIYRDTLQIFRGVK